MTSKFVNLQSLEKMHEGMQMLRSFHMYIKPHKLNYFIFNQRIEYAYRVTASFFYEFHKILHVQAANANNFQTKMLLDKQK